MLLAISFTGLIRIVKEVQAMERRCYNCRYFLEDISVNAADCNRADDMTEEEFEKHFGNDEPDCPYWKEVQAYDNHDIRRV